MNPLDNIPPSIRERHEREQWQARAIALYIVALLVAGLIGLLA